LSPTQSHPPRSSRTRWLEPKAAIAKLDFAGTVREGLTSEPKSLPCTFLYDEEGSRLFEEICELPEYYLTRAEGEILERAAPDLAARLPTIETVVELGSGSAVKTESLLRAFQRDGRALRYAPIDVSRAALEESVDRLEETHPELEILPAIAEYEVGLAEIEDLELGPQLTLWLGSSIGNLEREDAADFLARRSANMSESDRMLVGIDLRKDREVLERAYDDSRGVTARFDLNLLSRINRELHGHFAPERFAHRVHYDEVFGRVRSYLESRETQSVRIDDLDLDVSFNAGERIHTEDSHKYSFEEIDDLALRAGLEVSERYLDSQGLFSLNLLEPRSPA